MKKLILLAVSLIVFNTMGFCQFESKDLKFTVAGLPLFGSSEDFSSGVNGFVIKPSIGFFISDRTSIDLNFSFASLDDLKVGNVGSYYNSFAIVPSIRNNFINSKNFRVFGEIGFGFGTIKYEADNGALRNIEHSDLSGGLSIFTAGVGMNYFFNDAFGIELILPYIKSTNITSSDNATIYSGVGPTLGLTYILN